MSPELLEVGARRLDDPVVMVSHQAVGMAKPPEAAGDLAIEAQKLATIGARELPRAVT
jgi:hypothetical protein